MSPEEIAALTEAFKAAIRDVLEASQPLPPKLMFGVDEAAQITALPRTWLYKEAQAGHIPSRKVGEHHRRFSLADLMAIVDASEVKPTSGPMARLERGQSERRRAA